MYSPKIREEFIPALYQLGKELKKPMTVVVNEIIGKALTEQAGSVTTLNNENRKEI